MSAIAKYAKWMLIVGGVILAIGEVIGAFFDKKPGGTISESWRDAPEPLKYFSFGAVCAVLAHFAWPMPPREVTVNVQHADTVEVEGVE